MSQLSKILQLGIRIEGVPTAYFQEGELIYFTFIFPVRAIFFSCPIVYLCIEHSI